MDKSINDLMEIAKSIPSPFRRQLAICSIITKAFKDSDLNPPILVGGSVVSVYSGGLYSTVDLDLKSESDHTYKIIMQDLGFIREGKDFYHSELKSYVEFPSGKMEDSMERIMETIVEETGLPIYLIGIEDIILDRLNGFVATGDANAREWAARLLLTYYGEIDWSYIHKQSHKNGTFSDFEKLQKEIKRYRRIQKEFQDRSNSEMSASSETYISSFRLN